MEHIYSLDLSSESQPMGRLLRERRKSSTDQPRDIYDIWANYPRPRGYQLRFIVNKLPGSLPENVGIVVSWDD
jgi:hypothetical protein